MHLRKYFEIGIGEVPVILSCPHGGYKRLRRIPNKPKGPDIPDKNTYLITKMIIKRLIDKNTNIFYILNKIHRSKVDLNRPPMSETALHQGSIEALNIHNLFHDQIDRFTQDCILTHNRCLLIDFHGFTKPSVEYPDIIFGHVFGKTLKRLQDNSKDNCHRYWGCAQLQDQLSKYFILDDGLGINDYNLSYSGGYITQRFCNQNEINAIQIEIAKHIRFDSELTSKVVNSLVQAIIESLHS